VISDDANIIGRELLDGLIKGGWLVDLMQLLLIEMIMLMAVMIFAQLIHRLTVDWLYSRC